MTIDAGRVPSRLISTEDGRSRARERSSSRIGRHEQGRGCTRMEGLTSDVGGVGEHMLTLNGSIAKKKSLPKG